ncbi:MAG: NADH-quinone oxidoreductase subunit J [Candidatus Marinimicrobia bacterium]|jgi:NADH-quinone oxidoreductase subunit J|nr:NADH-quinone oxidoreductase subunit J [Candidatus Neomarinimicrobiota bacterium]|tara:strand:+ start:1054 stop:1542 length:489 start_codon:yes stop_codon:yes gene_type:complete
MADYIFWLVVTVTVVSAAVVVLNSQLIYSAVALLFTLFGVAGLYVFLWADFIAGVQLLVYVGGILVLIIFGIMLTNRISSVRISHKSVQQGVGGAVVVWLFIFLSIVVIKTPWLDQPAIEPSNSVAKVGTLLLTKYLLPFEVVSILLLGALIGAAVLSREDT